MELEDLLIAQEKLQESGEYVKKRKVVNKEIKRLDAELNKLKDLKGQVTEAEKE